jgi:REP element-mobilizing transposase RayT
LFVKILDEVRSRFRFPLIGYVVMPEHVHLLIGEPRIGTPSKVMQVLKQRVSRAMRRKQKPASHAQLLPGAPFLRSKSGSESSAPAFSALLSRPDRPDL